VVAGSPAVDVGLAATGLAATGLTMRPVPAVPVMVTVAPAGISMLAVALYSWV
jgi:hypothetical protein